MARVEPSDVGGHKLAVALKDAILAVERLGLREPGPLVNLCYVCYVFNVKTMDCVLFLLGKLWICVLFLMGKLWICVIFKYF